MFIFARKLVWLQWEFCNIDKSFAFLLYFFLKEHSVQRIKEWACVMWRTLSIDTWRFLWMLLHGNVKNVLLDVFHVEADDSQIDFKAATVHNRNSPFFLFFFTTLNHGKTEWWWYINESTRKRVSLDVTYPSIFQRRC